MKIEITADEAKAIARSFRLVVGYNTENPDIQKISLYAKDLKTLERAANRLSRKLCKLEKAEA